MRRFLVIALLIVFAACAKKSADGEDSGVRSPKKAFRPPAGAFNVEKFADEHFSGSKEEDQAASEGETTEEAPVANEAAPEAPAEPETLASNRETASDVRVEPAPDLGAHLINPSGGQAAILPPKGGGLPPSLLAPGSAREIDVRAERLHRLLVADNPEPLPGKVIVRVYKDRLTVTLEVPVNKDLSVQDFARLAENVANTAAKVLPEVEHPEEYLRIEVRSRKRVLAEWENGGWRFNTRDKRKLSLPTGEGDDE